MTLEELQKEYTLLCHAMQSGVAFKINIDNSETTPKHLRVGVNSAMVETAALTRLLISKGVFSEREHWEMLVAVMREEVNSYKQFLSDRLGGNIDLG